MSQPTTLGALRDTGYRSRSVKTEIRENLLSRLRSGQTAFPGIVGFDDTVLPQLESALLAGHDLVLLGERGQGKTRLMRTISDLLDEWTPVVAGCEINDDPEAPVCARCRKLAGELGDELPVGWLHRGERYVEKLATPDTSVGDLVGDVDPVKVAEGRTLGDPETVHYGLLPRTNRGVFGVNELPDLAERIQVSMFNVLEERDIQVRGYSLRLPIDVLLVASANPEDYTNRGRIITPLKDRFGAEIRTHYPHEVHEEVTLVAQEAVLVADVPEHLLEVVARLTRGLRDSPAVDHRSGISARFAIAAAEGIAASALRRGARVGEGLAVARVCDVPTVVPTLLGKVEFEMGEEGRETEVVQHLLRVAVAETFRDRLAPPYDVRAALDEMSHDVLSGGSLREALSDLLRRGFDGNRGLDDLAARVRRLRSAARRRGDLGGTLDQVRSALDQALAEERDTLAGEDGDDARWAEMELATLPDDTAGAVRALSDYDWHSPEARATYESIQQMLRREVLDEQFAGLKRALDDPDPEAMQRVKDMLADLNALLAAHARGEDTEDRFRDFMDKHGDLFPENPEDVDELIDALARRQAAADRMMASLSPEQREQLGQLMSDAMGDADLASEMAQLSDNLRALRPGMDRGSPTGMRPGGESLGYSEAVEAVAELADLEALEAQLSHGQPTSTLDDVDVDLLEKRLGR